MFYLTMHSTHFIYGYMASVIWQSTIQIAREKIRCHYYVGYSFRLGPVRSECLTCTFRASCCSARLSRAQGGGSKGYWQVQKSTSSPTRVGNRRRVFWGVMEFGMSRRTKSKEKYVRISMKEIWRSLEGPPKIKNLWSYVVVLKLVCWKYLR